MIAKHTPQSLMTMEMMNGKWVFKDVTMSKTLNYYETFGIREIHRVPMHLHGEAVMRDLIHNEQVAHCIKEGVDMLRVNTGAYISILCHTESIGVQSH